MMCKEIFPDMPDLPDHCTQCSTNLFKRAATLRGTVWKTHIPEIKYPYLSLEDQLQRLLQIGKERADMINAPDAPSAPDGAPSVASATAPKKDQAYSMHPEDPANFLMLSEVLCLLCQDKISVPTVMKVDTLLRQYCTDLIKASKSHLYGITIRPNHHYATHITEFVLDYGPLHTF
ncbi:hypothetical protein A0H81_09173 [Grifola frondosa]|uniref:Uncharacterized protein n=1 Tax=Grifola frondosa TaxID=5627 RepID=A0A1C7M151_GRIFR|nr:hypothetical protein A0H81_09173 [Grifola frondosa]